MVFLLLFIFSREVVISSKVWIAKF